MIPEIIHMSNALILASSSQTRLDMLTNAGVPVEVHKPRIDEEMIKSSMLVEDANPRDIADTLAEMKALKISEKHPGRLVLGCDQVLNLKGEVFSKAGTIAEARSHLLALRGNTHSLLSAAVLYQDSKPLWRHVGIARMSMRDFSESYLDEYLARNWEDVRYCVGCYKLEAEGVRLFSQVVGSHFTVLGLPLMELLTYLTLKGDIAG